MDTLELKGIEVSCIIGDRPDERRHEQILLVDAALEMDLEPAAKSDLLVDTVDYPTLAEDIRKALRTARCQMIERACALVAEVCLRDKRVARVRVRVEKRGAVVGLHAAAVTLVREQMNK